MDDPASRAGRGRRTGRPRYAREKTGSVVEGLAAADARLGSRHSKCGSPWLPAPAAPGRSAGLCGLGDKPPHAARERITDRFAGEITLRPDDIHRGSATRPCRCRKIHIDSRQSWRGPITLGHPPNRAGYGPGAVPTHPGPSTVFSLPGPGNRLPHQPPRGRGFVRLRRSYSQNHGAAEGRCSTSTQWPSR